MKRIFTLAFLLAVSSNAFSQEQKVIKLKVDTALYDTDLLPARFHIERRNALREQMPEGSGAVFFAAPVRNRANDVDYEYHQDPNFYYYSGHIQPGAVMMVFKEPQTINGITASEFLFVKERDPLEESWTGKIQSKEEVALKSGVKNVLTNEELPDISVDFSKLTKLLIKFPTDINENSKEEGSAGWLVSKFKEKTRDESGKYDRVQYARINSKLREIKTIEEIFLLQKAVDITCKGFIEALKAAEPGMKEFELESINEFIWKREGAEYTGYPSIVGGGGNSCVLHYETNRKKLVNGDIIVMDIGAEYHGYTADVTRSFPINGKFTPEQKIIYQIVYDAQKAGIEACLPGNSFQEPHKAASKVITDGLIKNGIIKDESEVSKYFTHGTSHYLGLDVHDPGTYGKLQPNSVITVEPGIYITEGADCDKKWWNIGVRIEDDVLITPDGYRVMSDCVGKTIGEIEALMAQKSIFNQLK